MFWSTLIFAILALALAAAVWGVLRRKWYGLLPLLAVIVVGWLWDGSFWEITGDFFHACVNQSPVTEVMILILAGGAAGMALAALWAGWSRGWWFWRALVFAAVPASLVPLEANELILVCLLVMPALTSVAWLRRQRHDRFDSRPDDERPRGRKQFSLANLFLAFIVLGLLATALRSVLVGHIMLADWGLVWLAASIVAAALAAASPVLARGSGRKWLIFWSAALPLGAASWWWLKWNSDTLGLANYIGRGSSGALALSLIEGELCFLALVGLPCGIFAILTLPPPTQTKVRIAHAVSILLAMGFLVPVALIYPGLIPPKTTRTALPPSKEHEAILRAGHRLYDLDLQAGTANPLAPVGVTRRPLLGVLDELDGEVLQPGHVTHDLAELARARILRPRGGDPMNSLSMALYWETLRAIHDKRDADAIRLARLQWRVGRTYYRGGTTAEFFFGFDGHEHVANPTIIAQAPSLSDQVCRDLLIEALATEASDVTYEELREFDDYWIYATSGWRDRLRESAVWLTGERYPGDWRWRLSPAEFQKRLRRPLGSLRTVQYVLALELYRREHGRFPESLAEVQAAYDLPDCVDSFTQFAPVYRRTETGFLLYSVGLDGKDDGGDFPPPDNKAIPPDSANQDINLVPDREELAKRWAEYLEATSPVPPPPPPPAPTGTEATPEGDDP